MKEEKKEAMCPNGEHDHEECILQIESIGQRPLKKGELKRELEIQNNIHGALNKICPKAWFTVYEGADGAVVLLTSHNEHSPGHSIKELLNLIYQFIHIVHGAREGQ